MNKNYYHRFRPAGVGLLGWAVLCLAACVAAPGQPAGVAPPPVSTAVAAAPAEPATATAAPPVVAEAATAPPAGAETAAMAGTAPEETAAVPFTTIAQGALLGAEPAEPVYTMLEPAEWGELKALLPESLLQAGLPAGDDQALIVAVAGVKDSSGYELTIDSITRSGSQLTVVVAEAGPAPDQVVEPATTVPYHIVAVDRSALADAAAGKVVFLDTAGNVLKEEGF